MQEKTINILGIETSCDETAAAVVADGKVVDIGDIDDLTIEFSDGLSILSGETGAGKSIIVNAVNLLLGAFCMPRHCPLR